MRWKYKNLWSILFNIQTHVKIAMTITPAIQTTDRHNSGKVLEQEEKDHDGEKSVAKTW